MKHLEDLFSVMPTWALKMLFLGLMHLQLAEDVRRAVYFELRFRRELDDELNEAAYPRPRRPAYGRTVRGVA